MSVAQGEGPKRVRFELFEVARALAEDAPDDATLDHQVMPHVAARLLALVDVLAHLPVVAAARPIVLSPKKVFLPRAGPCQQGGPCQQR